MRTAKLGKLVSAARRSFAGVVVAMSVAFAVATAAPAAQAVDVELLSCTGSGANTYQPGVTAQPRVVSITSSADYGSCVSSGSPTITSGGYAITANGLVSCLGGGVSITVTIAWNTGETTTVAAVGLVVLRPANEVVVVYQGTVTAGQFTGAAVVMTAALLNTTPAQCLTPEGVTGTSGPANITITQLG
ncbi:hypothetical protein ACFFSW_17860 [Saccharothrix longispora]|uniref:Ig-like domain-containing protein n=1 Tax=Saccharothrix longispora TaxID=33920 RepID=A0ABU1PSD0_9PSEU|nr:hypothetical protein [Saccharothrix longispora]MDR6593557.1 hypothetical protein [Saccharothrix longispora]